MTLFVSVQRSPTSAEELHVQALSEVVMFSVGMIGQSVDDIQIMCNNLNVCMVTDSLTRWNIQVQAISAIASNAFLVLKFLLYS